MPEEPSQVSRRGFVSTGATLLAGFGLSAALPASRALASTSAGAAGSGVVGYGTAPGADLALYRPVSVSSTDYAPTPAAFAVDRVAEVGRRGTGWRALAGDPQWIAVDLQAPCTVSSVVLTFEAQASDPAFPTDGGGNPYANTTGDEILSSCAVAFTIDTSADGTSWTTAYSTTSGTGGVTTVPLPKPVAARWVRMTATQRSTSNPLGLNGFQVYGACDTKRPAARGWSSWGGNREPAPPLAVAADGTVPIESGWDLTLDDWAGSTDGSALSGPAVDTTDWVPATVPGSVLASLVEQGHFPDPVYGMNNLQIPEALSRHAWWYRRSFEVPKELRTGDGRHVWLEFDGINHQGDVWVNGTKVGEVVHPFARGSFDIAKALHAAGEQVVAVQVAPMPHPGTSGDKGPDGQSFVNSDQLFLDAPTYASASGWDWMPAVRDRGAGIWNHVRLRSTGDAVIGDPRVDTKLPNLPAVDVAEVTLTVPVRNVGDAAVKVTVTAAFDDVSVSTTVTVAAGASSDVVFAPTAYKALVVESPKLWWPNGYGEPALHDLALTLKTGGAVSDTRTVRFGMRQYDYVATVPIVVGGDDRVTQTEDFAAQTARYLRIQCGTRATSWGDSIWTLSVFDSTKPGTDLALNTTATASSIDNTGDEPQNAVDGDPNTRWSSGYEDDQWIQLDLGSAVTFDQVVIVWEQAYAATYTIQVSADGSTWTDVLAVDNTPIPLKIIVNGVPVFCRGGSWGYDELLRRMLPDRMNAVMAMHRDMNFVMVRNWIGSSHREEFFAAADENGILVWNEFWDGFGAEPLDATTYVAQAKDTILRYRTHPSIVVWFGCNEGNPPTDIAAGVASAVTDNTDLLYQPDSNTGVITGDGPYHWLDPVQYFTGEATGNSIGFHSEIGIPTVSVTESMRNLVGPDDAGWPIDAPWFLHDWSSQGNQAPQTYQAAIDARLGTSSSLDEFCTKAQFVNYESMRAIFEAWNARLWDDATGVLLWMSHPAWHSTVWQTYDYDLDVNGSYYGSRKGSEPLHVQANLSDWSVVAVNHTAAALKNLTVAAKLYDLDGKSLGLTERQKRIDLAASSSSPAFTVAFTDAMPALHLLRLELRDKSGTVLSENTYWRYRADTDMQALNAVPHTRVSVTAGKAGTGTLTATLRNTGSSVAAMLRLSLRDRHTGDRILPTRYSDNYFWLLPGESRTVTMTWNTSTTKVGEPQLVVSGYNVPATTA